MRMSRWWKASDATSDGLNVAVLRRTEAQSEAAFMGRTSAMAVVVRNVEHDIGIQVAC